MIEICHAHQGALTVLGGYNTKEVTRKNLSPAQIHKFLYQTPNVIRFDGFNNDVLISRILHPLCMQCQDGKEERKKERKKSCLLK